MELTHAIFRLETPPARSEAQASELGCCFFLEDCDR